MWLPSNLKHVRKSRKREMRDDRNYQDLQKIISQIEGADRISLAVIDFYFFKLIVRYCGPVFFPNYSVNFSFYAP